MSKCKPTPPCAPGGVQVFLRQLKVTLCSNYYTGSNTTRGVVCQTVRDRRHPQKRPCESDRRLVGTKKEITLSQLRWGVLPPLLLSVTSCVRSVTLTASHTTPLSNRISRQVSYRLLMTKLNRDSDPTNTFMSAALTIGGHN